MKLIEVKGRKEIKGFHLVPRIIYRNDRNYIFQPESEIEKLFDPSVNKSLETGEAIRWVLLDLGGKPCGRIAAFYDTRKCKIWKEPTGGIGFFECIDDSNASEILFTAARNWLSEKGMQAMEGPVNFGENQYNWGLLSEGSGPPVYGMQYHPPYYQALFLHYGFMEFYKQFSYTLDLTSPFPERFWNVAGRIASRPEITCKHFTIKEKDLFIRDMLDIYNGTWETFREEAPPLTFEDIDAVFRSARPILVEEFIWFVYKNGDPACFLIMFPDINQVLAHLNGKTGLWAKLKFLWWMKRKTISRARALVMGIKPEYQRLGLESLIFYNLKDVFERRKNYQSIELAWSGDFNPRILSLYAAMGATHSKTHLTMKYLFDRSAPFERYHLPQISEIPRRIRGMQEI